MGVSKVIYGNTTLIDISGDTVTSSTLISGETAHDASGTAIIGTASKIVITSDGTTPPSDKNAIWIYPDDLQDLSEEEY